MDPRLSLPDCTEDLGLSLNGGFQTSLRIQVRVQCRGDIPWSKYVPAEVQIFMPIFVASENIRRGTILEAHHFQLIETDLSRLRRTPVTDPEQALGMQLKHSLTTGSPLSLEGLERPKVIHRGDLVQLVAESETLQIKQRGEALQDGAVGKLINVRNSSSDLVVQAVVVAEGKVKIQL